MCTPRGTPPRPTGCNCGSPTAGPARPPEHSGQGFAAAFSGVVGAGGAGSTYAETTKATTTATMTSGVTASPSESSSSVASRTEVIGSRSIVTHIAPIPMAAAGTTGNPGKWDNAIPPAAPRNIAGKIGPPRNPPNDTPYARPLHTSSTTRVPAV